MLPEIQREFIRNVTDRSYTTFKQNLEADLGTPIHFRVCEMPIFVSHHFREMLQNAAVGIIEECVQPAVLASTDRFMTNELTTPRQSSHPLFSVVDFAVTKTEAGDYEPRLIELQGFPSLFGYQYEFASRMIDFYGIVGATPFFSDYTVNDYISILKQSLFGKHDPGECALMEIDPREQKTLPDFLAMKRLVGIDTVNLRDVFPVGNSLVVEGNGTRRLRRIFNRSIVDELTDLGVTPAFKWNEDYDVEWAGHPNWYYRISKAIMPWLSHPTVPKTLFVDQLSQMPADLSRYVLKPLFAFAGKGIELNPTSAHITSIPESERSLWVLQEKVMYDACIPTPHGNNFVEIRVMLIWPDAQARPIPVMSLARTGRGALMGARFNVDPWTGSSGCVFL